MQGISFLTDGDGSRTAVVIDLDMYGDLIEDLLDAAVSRSRDGEEDIPWAEVRAEVVRDLHEGVDKDAAVSSPDEAAGSS